MNPQVSRARRAARLAALLGTASFFTMPGSDALAQADQNIEEVLVTGSLIRGAPAVGVPVTALSEQDFAESGALTITDLLRDVPALSVAQESSPSQGGGRLSGVNNVSIHGLSTGAGNEALLLIDGLRVPPQNYSLDSLDPSIVPHIALQRIDVLTAGASATYGADATSGVINVVLRRGFDGAISDARINMSTDIGRFNYQVGQLYGRTWETGSVTVGLEWTEQQNQRADVRDYYTTNFEPYGLHDQTPLTSSNPGIVHLTTQPTLVVGAPPGASARVGTRYCSNCFALPKGIGWNFGEKAPGPTTTWAAIMGGAFVPGKPNTQDQENIWAHAEARPHEQSAQSSVVFDQQITNDFLGLGPLSGFIDGFYSARRSNLIWMAEGGDARDTLIREQLVPTTNPYYPTGAPANLRINFSLAGEIPQIVRGAEHAGRYATGLNFDKLPGDWRGKFVYSMTEVEAMGQTWQPASVNNVRAALGQTVASVPATSIKPAFAAFTKPSSVPYLNPFCDRNIFKCNSPATIDYVTGFRDQRSVYKVQEVEATFDGPLIDLPGGPIVGAVSVETTGFRFSYTETQNFRTSSTSEIILAPSYNKERIYAVVGELNVPIFSQQNAMPLFQSLEIELGYRIDRYIELDTDVYTPKIGANWNVGFGLTLRGAYGTAFRSPNPGEQNGPTFTSSTGVNLLGGATSDGTPLNCPAQGGGAAGVANAGTLQAALNPTCSSAAGLLAPGGISVGGGGRGGAELLRGHGLGPQHVKQWFVGFNFAPTEGILKGVNLDAQYFDLHYTDLISGGFPGDGVNDPRSFVRYHVIPNPSAPITDPSNAEFFELLQRIGSLPTRGGEVFDQAFLSNVKFIVDNAIDNIGERVLQGIDFNGLYSYDMEGVGVWNIGASGYYEVDSKQKDNDFAPIISDYDGRHTGNRLKRVRYRLGWSSMDGAWSVNLFARYVGHGSINTNGNNSLPLCYYSTAVNPNTGAPYKAGDCYAGSPFYGPYSVYPNFTPGTAEGDFQISYSTGDMPTNEYLRNVRIDLSVNNFLNKQPPFQIGLRGSLRDGRAFDNSFSDQQRVVAFSVAKTW